MKSLIILSIFILSLCLVKSEIDSDMPTQIMKCPEIKQEACNKMYSPTCAWFDPRVNHICKHYPCGKNASNPCMACNIRDVVSYSNGPCPEKHVLFEPKKKEVNDLEGLSFTFCNEASKKAKYCTMEYEPQCAWLDDKVNCGSAKTPCGVNAGNRCMACIVKNAVKFSFGSCPPAHLYKEIKEDKLQYTMCDEDSKNAEVWPMVFDPMCAWFDSSANCNSDKKPCAVQASNGCEACRVREAVKFSAGECPKANLVKDM